MKKKEIRMNDTDVFNLPTYKEIPSVGLYLDQTSKYINEVLPRMAAEAETGNWETVDEYTDRLLQYQRTFSATTPIRQAGGSTTTILAGFLLLLFIASARTSCSGRSRG